MGLKKLLISFAKLLAAAVACTGIYFFCEAQTKGFRPYLILSDLPNDTRWEVPPLSREEQQNIDALLEQPFTFLDAGGWCIAFLGQDQKTILKFYRHSHLLPLEIMSNFSLRKLLLKSPSLPSSARYFQEFVFNSCTLLYKEHRERSGILYVHLNKTNGMHQPVTLIDNIGIKHTIDLDKTEFVVQKRAELILPYIHRLAMENKIDEAKHRLDDMLDCLLGLCKSGMRDLDPSLRHNFGFSDGVAITLDLSSFELDESIKKPGEYKKELVMKSRPLSRFLRKNHPELYRHFEDRLSEIMEQGQENPR